MATVFKPKTKAEKQLVRLVQGMLERIQSDGFSEWHAWEHSGSRGKCPNSSPFFSFLKGWLQEDEKARLPIYLAAFQEYARGPAVFDCPNLKVFTKKYLAKVKVNKG